MANRKTAAQQALKDMMELGFDITFFHGNIRKYSLLNIELGIENQQQRKTEEIHIEVCINYMPPEVFKPVPRKRYMINPDGTISSLYSDWDKD